MSAFGHGRTGLADPLPGIWHEAFGSIGSDKIDYKLEAHIDAEWGCVNGGSKHPPPANEETVSSQVSATASLEPKNGRVVATIKTAAPTAGDFECPAGQKLVFGSVSYTDIEL